VPAPAVRHRWRRAPAPAYPLSPPTRPLHLAGQRQARPPCCLRSGLFLGGVPPRMPTARACQRRGCCARFPSPCAASARPRSCGALRGCAPRPRFALRARTLPAWCRFLSRQAVFSGRLQPRALSKMPVLSTAPSGVGAIPILRDHRRAPCAHLCRFDKAAADVDRRPQRSVVSPCCSPDLGVSTAGRRLPAAALQDCTR
jgi:hypothetical protein